jgi:NAD(P)-dependent dehydrogenase (short-subunit alcohol dehydrogenase family)
MRPVPDDAPAVNEFAMDGITVNAYCPGVVGTDMWLSSRGSSTPRRSAQSLIR